MRKLYLLDDPTWKWDAMPEIWEGKNVVDFVDPDIEAKLAALEAEEEVREGGGDGEGRETGVNIGKHLSFRFVGVIVLGMSIPGVDWHYCRIKA